MPETPIAAFDFDGTLTRRDTLFGFLRFARGPLALGRALGRCTPTVVRARFGRTPTDIAVRDAGKEQLLRDLFAGRDEAWLHERGEEYARTLTRRLRPDMVRRLDWHRRRGHRLVIVSASLHTYLRHFGDEHGFDEVIAVELEAEDGTLTGALRGPNVRGPEKETRLRSWLDGIGARGELWAYGNSTGDRELLAMADRPLLVGRAAVGSPAPIDTPSPVDEALDDPI